MNTFNTQTNGNNSPININVQSIDIGSKKFIECSDDELLDYGLELARRFKIEKVQKRKIVISNNGKLLFFLLFLWVLAFLYTTVNSQDRHILELANFFCCSAGLLLAVATFFGFNKPNITEQDYMDTADNIIRELNFRQNKNYSDRIYRAFRK